MRLENCPKSCKVYVERPLAEKCDCWRARKKQLVHGRKAKLVVVVLAQEIEHITSS
jgi:hypothetical protein